MIDPFTYWSRTAAALATTAHTGRQLVETAVASCKVVVARTGPAASEGLMIDSSASREAGRIIPEKVKAAAASAQALSAAWWKVQVELIDQSARMTQLMTKGRSPTIAEATEFWSTSAMSALRLLESSADMGRDVLRPYHRATAKNARRLSGM